MKRSDVNSIIQDAIEFFNYHKFNLPKWGYFNYEQWRKEEHKINEIIDLQLGWDITDFGSSQFEKCGLTLFTIRNGRHNSLNYKKLYAEKIMISRVGQITPLHYHMQKSEDIINRGGGILAMQVYEADESGDKSNNEFSLSVDGIEQYFQAGDWLYLHPGQSVTLTPRIYHEFHAQNERVLIGEVSSVNDDKSDNYFYENVGRFPEIEEDVDPIYLLVNDYKSKLRL